MRVVGSLVPGHVGNQETINLCRASMLPVPSSLMFSSPVGVFEIFAAAATKAVMDAVVMAMEESATSIIGK